MTTPGIHLVQHEAAHEDAGGIPARRFGVPEEINEGVEVLLTATATSPAPRKAAWLRVRRRFQALGRLTSLSSLVCSFAWIHQGL